MQLLEAAPKFLVDGEPAVRRTTGNAAYAMNLESFPGSLE
jgi:hypothetical protein